MQINPSHLSPRHTHLDDLLVAKLEIAFEHDDQQDVDHDVSKIASEYNYIDLAYAASRLPQDQRPILYYNLPDFETKMQLILHAEASTREVIFEELEDSDLLQLIEATSPQKAVDLLESISEERRSAILRFVEVGKLSRIKQIEQYDEDSAGRLMTNEFFAFPHTSTIAEAARYIRELPHFDLSHNIFVLDETGCLLGYIPMRMLIVNPPHIILQQMVRPIFHKVLPETPRDKILFLFERYKIRQLPVIDLENLLVGVITDIEVFEVLEDRVTETIAHIVGTDEDVSTTDPLVRRFWARVPWLFCTACGGMINMKVQSSFQWFNFGIFFVSLITGLSGNIGLQCSTILLRNIAGSSLSRKNKQEMMRSELTVGVLTGVAFGLFCSTLVFTLTQMGFLTPEFSALKLGIIVGAGLIGACWNATFLGVFTPFFFAHMGVDPAVAAGPIVTAFNDIIATIIYFIIGSLIQYYWV